MTRQQVARRLGKSLATVRRIEGVLLHPTRDSRGIHRFDGAEVEALARGIESGDVTVWHELRRDSADDTPVDFSSPHECDACAALEQQVSGLREAVRRQRENHEREVTALRDEQRRARIRHETEARELHDQLTEFLAMIEG